MRSARAIACAVGEELQEARERSSQHDIASTFHASLDAGHGAEDLQLACPVSSCLSLGGCVDEVLRVIIILVMWYHRCWHDQHHILGTG